MGGKFGRDRRPKQQLYAIYDYEPLQKGDVAFKSGEILLVKGSVDGKNWLRVTRQSDGVKGYAPSNFLKKPDDPHTLPGFMEGTRVDIERELIRPVHQSGTWAIRPRSDNSKEIVLSLKAKEEEDLRIFHYKINKSEDTKFVWINSNNKFPSVQQLLDYYKENSGTKCRLTGPIEIDAAPVTPFRDLKIDSKLIQLEDGSLGSGSFGVVKRGRLGRVDVAVKQLKIENGMGTEASLIEEAETQYKLSHRNVVQLIGFTRPANSGFWLIMEFAEKGSIRSHIKKASFEQHLDYIRQVANGMAYLELQQVLHRDLRTANLLLTDKDEVKIADFGLARVLEQQDNMYTIEAAMIYNGSHQCNFPVRWTAPEGLQKHEFSVKSDVWSFGICAYEILTGGRKPYDWLHRNADVKDFVCKGEVLDNPLKGKFAGKDKRVQTAEFLYEEVLKECWKQSPRDRPTFKYLAGIFEDLETSVNNSTENYK